jgi:hypothetical protein
MKHVYPPRHPAWLDGKPSGETSTSRGNASEPALPHEHDESSHGQAAVTPQQREIGRKAYGNAIDGSADTDRGPVLDKVYNEKVAPHRGPDEPRQ